MLCYEAYTLTLTLHDDFWAAELNATAATADSFARVASLLIAGIASLNATQGGEDGGGGGNGALGWDQVVRAALTPAQVVLTSQRTLELRMPQAQRSTAPHRTAPHRTAPHRTAPHRTAPHRTASHRIASHRIASHRIAYAPVCCAVRRGARPA
jgi:hypothetical protein